MAGRLGAAIAPVKLGAAGEGLTRRTAGGPTPGMAEGPISRTAAVPPGYVTSSFRTAGSVNGPPPAEG